MARGREANNVRGNFTRGPNRICAGKGPGYLYLLRRSDGLHKIGHTINVKKRLTYNRYENRGYHIDLIHTVYVSCRIEEERYWHDLFATKRIWREWFDLSEQDIQRFIEWEPTS